MSVMESLVTRRTYRRFAQKPVPQDVVDDIVEAVRLSSCGANRQALRLVVVQSPEMVAKVQPLVKWAAYLPPEQGMPKADETPTLYVAVLQDSSAPGDLSTDTGIALANMTLAAWDKEVGSCIMGAINKPALTELLGIGGSLCNVFEPIVLQEHFDINYIRSMMYTYGAYGAQMTGSGSAVFGIYDSFEYATVACTMLKDKYSQIFLAKTV